MENFMNLHKYETLSDFISDAIKEKNITRQRLAELLDIHPAKVYRWVSGASLPKQDAVVRIAHFFNLSREDINTLIEKQKRKKYKKRGRKKKVENKINKTNKKSVNPEIEKLLKKKEKLEKKLYDTINEIVKIEVKLNLLGYKEE